MNSKKRYLEVFLNESLKKKLDTNLCIENIGEIPGELFNKTPRWISEEILRVILLQITQAILQASIEKVF